jgi:Rne/Rng family ribonuclease
MKKEMLINVLQPEECRIAIIEDGVLEELYVERTSHESYVGNIYKGRIVNIEPSIQAAFVDFGVGRNGFLHVSDVEPAYYRHLEPPRDAARRGRGRLQGAGARSPRPAEGSERDTPAMPTTPLTEETAADPSASREEAGSSGEPAEAAARASYSPPAAAAQLVPPPETSSAAADEPLAETHLPAERPRPMASAEHRTRETPQDLTSEAPRTPSEKETLANHLTLPAEASQPADNGPEVIPQEPEETFPSAENAGQRGPRRRSSRRAARAVRPKPLIQDIFKRGQEVLVQVIKEGIGTKGPTLSTYISIPGRYLVLMPGLNRIGVSRKITDEEQRRRLKEILAELNPPKGLGFIIRTAGLDRTKKELQRDLAYLSRLWQVVVRRIRKLKAPCEIYQESDMITRTIRDIFTSEIDTIWVDEANAFAQAQEFMQIVMPRYANRIKLYNDPVPMFHKYGIEEEIARIQQKHVPLPNGGSIVIEPTEALVAIDVNSGNFRADNNAEETAYQMNLIAAKEIARQLRLRDLGGVIVNDFIDMREEKHRRAVEKALRDAVKRDRARTKILRMSQFGIIEMTRQRIRPSLKRSIYQDCPCCHGSGQVKTCESMSIDVMRLLLLAAHRDDIQRIHIRVQEEVASYLLNRKRKEITHLEETTGTQVVITAVPGASPEFLEFLCYDSNNNEVKFPNYDDPRLQRR